MFAEEKRKKAERGSSGSARRGSSGSGLVMGTSAGSTGSLGSLAAKHIPPATGSASGLLSGKKSLGPIGLLQDGLAVMNAAGMNTQGSVAATAVPSGVSGAGAGTGQPARKPNVSRPLSSIDSDADESLDAVSGALASRSSGGLPPRPGSANPNSAAKIAPTGPVAVAPLSPNSADAHRKEALRRDSEERDKIDRDLQAARATWMAEREAADGAERRLLEEQSNQTLQRLKAEASDKETSERVALDAQLAILTQRLRDQLDGARARGAQQERDLVDALARELAALRATHDREVSVTAEEHCLKLQRVQAAHEQELQVC